MENSPRSSVLDYEHLFCSQGVYVNIIILLFYFYLYNQQVKYEIVNQGCMKMMKQREEQGEKKINRCDWKSNVER